MTSVRGRRHSRWESSSVASSVTFFNSFLSLKLDDKLSKQPTGLSKIKLLVTIALVAAINIPKYSEDDLQRIFMTVLEARALALTLVLALAVSKVLRDKLKA